MQRREVKREFPVNKGLSMRKGVSEGRSVHPRLWPVRHLYAPATVAHVAYLSLLLSRLSFCTVRQIASARERALVENVLDPQHSSWYAKRAEVYNLFLCAEIRVIILIMMNTCQIWVCCAMFRTKIDFQRTRENKEYNGVGAPKRSVGYLCL